MKWAIVETDTIFHGIRNIKQVFKTAYTFCDKLRD